MNYVFPSRDWADRYKSELNQSEAYRTAASTWHHGAIAFVVHPDPDLGLPDGFCLWLDVDGGTCRGAREVSIEKARQAPFCLVAPYSRWKKVIERRLDPIAGMVTRQLVLEGDLLTMMRYVRSAKAMVQCATRVPSTFLAPVTS